MEQGRAVHLQPGTVGLCPGRHTKLKRHTRQRRTRDIMLVLGGRVPDPALGHQGIPGGVWDPNYK